MSSTTDNDHGRHIDTNSGSYVAGGVQTGGGDFVGGDKHVHGDEVRGDKIIHYEGPAYSRFNYRAESAYLVTYLTEHFVGRTKDLQVVADFAAEPAPGYLLLEAPAGFGKSALMAQLIRQLAQGAWRQTVVPQLLYFFIRRQTQQHTAAALLRALNSQLLDLLQRPGGVPPELASLQSQFSELWNLAITQASETHPLLLVIDGLDEMQAEQGETSIAQILPSSLAPHVHVVVTSRPSPSPWTYIPLEHPLRSVEVYRLQRFGESEVQELLEQYGVANDVVSRLSRRVLEITNGEPLFARFVCQDVAAKGEAALVLLEKSPPRDVRAYFQGQLAQLRSLATSQLSRDILGLLLVVLGGISAEEIADILGTGRWNVDEAITPIRRFLIGDETLELMHLQLKGAVADLFSRREKQAYPQKLLDWCRTYEAANWPDETPPYILEHYAQHLQAMDAREELKALFADQHWMKARIPQRAYTYDGYLADLEIAWAQADRDARQQIDAGEIPTAFVDCFRYALIRTSVNSIAEAYIPELIRQAVDAELWSMDRALSVAARVPTAGGRVRLCTALLETGQADPEQRTILQNLGYKEALSIAKEASWAEALTALVPQLPPEQRLAVLQQALEAALSITSESSRARALAALARQLTSAMLQQALEAALSITGLPSRARALAALAPQLPAEQQPIVLQQALEAALSITSELSRAVALAALAPQLPAEQQPIVLQQALDAALSITSEWSRADALAALAPQLTGAMPQQALDAALTITDEWSRAVALVALAPQLTGAMLARALEAALSITSESSRADALAALAPQLPDELLPRASNAPLNMAPGLARAVAVRVFLGSKRALPAIVPTIRRDIVQHVWNMRNGPRHKVLALCEPASPIMPPVLSSELLSLMAEDIIDICENWHWL